MDRNDNRKHEISHKCFSKPDETRFPPKAKIEALSLPQHKFFRITAEPGWRWTNDMKSVAKTDLCQITHVGYVMSGSIGVMFQGKTERFQAGEVYEIPSGHDAWTEGQAPAVLLEFSQQSAEWGKQK